MSISLTALQAQSSLDFLQKAFELYGQGQLFAICRQDTDLSRYPGLRVTQTVSSTVGHGWLRPRWQAMPTLDDPAQIVFSSGTEGRPKAIVISGRALSDVEDRLIEVMDITSEIREYIGVPVTYSFGLGRARVIARVGGELYLPERFDPVEIKELLAAGEINAISAVPSLWRLLLAQPDFLAGLGQKVRWIEIGSQYMSAAEKLQMRSLFPNARIVQHYGLTEASRSSFLVIDQAAEDRLESVGRAFGLTEIRIGSEEEICIRGPHLASGIITDDGLVAPVCDQDGWLHTKDRGDIQGMDLYYRGRLDDQINLSGIKFASESLEARMAGLVQVGQGCFAVTGVRDLLRGEALLLAVKAEVADYARLLEAALAQAVQEKGVAAGQIRVLMLDELPLTGSGKIRRAALRDIWAEQPGIETQGADKTLDGDLDPQEERVAIAWRKVIGNATLHPDSSFYDLGGDSLAAMQLSLAMEAEFPRTVIRATLEGRSLREVALELGRASSDAVAHDLALLDKARRLPDRTIEAWSLNALRGLMVISVLMSHWMPGVWARLWPSLDGDPLAPLSRMGTPGFSMVFGIGVGYAMLHGWPDNRVSVRQRIRLSLMLVASAWGLLFVAHFSLALVEGHSFSGQLVAFAAYNVLGFYTLALLTLPFWLWLLSGRVWLVCALIIPGFWMAWRELQAIYGVVDPLPSILEWGRLMLVANYSYLHLIPTMLVGVVIGYLMTLVNDLQKFRKLAGRMGLFLLLLSLAHMTEEFSFTSLVDRKSGFWSGLGGAIFYAGVSCLFISVTIRALSSWNNLWSPLRGVLKVLILIGGLALPAYAFHQLVLPVKDLLEHAGLHGAISLALPMSAFLLAMAYGMRWLNRMYFR
ncbi:AMP-binding protein [Thioclava kandeliae]|uniref:AMP-binding protein n=1 Tax=Thioclava kandeliae TaxID=3070818 RepID=A0ABV1SLK2_9RHOB